MARRTKRFAWGTALATVLCGATGLWLSIGHGQEAEQKETPAPETLLPKDSVLYVGWDGHDAHRQAWEETAAYEALYTSGLADVVKKLFQAGAARLGPQHRELVGNLFSHLTNHGFSLAVSLAESGQGPPLPAVTFVLHRSADLQPGLAEVIKQQAVNLQFETRDVRGRSVTSAAIPQSPGIEVGWWSEGEHLVLVAGANPVQAALDIADGNTDNIAAGRNWTTYRDGATGFEVSCVGWLDFAALRDAYGKMPLPTPGPPGKYDPVPLNRLFGTLGLDTLGTIACQSGYQGKELWTETTLETTGERTGLLALADQQPITLDDLPPLPFIHSGFYACSFDWSQAYEQILKVVQETAALGPPDTAAQVEGMISQIPQLAGFDPQQDLFDALGNVSCVYGDRRQGLLFSSVAFVCEVNDAAALKKTLRKLADKAAAQARPGQFEVSTVEKYGREIVMFEIGGGFFNPAYAVDENWMVIGLSPQTVEAFLLRLDGRLTKWQPSRTYREGLAELPEEFTAISASDPRKSVRAIMQLATMILPAVRAGLRRGGVVTGDLPISPADLPPAELVARPLFPNLCMCTVDDEGIHWTTRGSLPSLPLLGSSGGGGGVASVGVLTALLLPAVQQARSAARRAQSKNNLKQLGLALHNYHDANGNLPPGTHPNEKLEPGERLSWMAKVLPFVGQGAIHDKIDFDKAWNDEANQKWAKRSIQVFQNPAADRQTTDDGYPVTHYVGIAGLGEDAPTLPATSNKAGAFGYNRKTKFRDVKDGLSNTLAITEASGDFGPWAAGGKPTIRAFTKKPYINGPDGIGGPWGNGMNAMMLDGSVRFISKDVDPEVLEALSTINGGERVGDF